jgi:hypothetical protein
MPDISAGEYPLVAQTMLPRQRTINDKEYNKRWNPQTKEDLQSRISQAMQSLQSVKKRLANNDKSVPLEVLIIY